MRRSTGHLQSWGNSCSCEGQRTCIASRRSEKVFTFRGNASWTTHPAVVSYVPALCLTHLSLPAKETAMTRLLSLSALALLLGCFLVYADDKPAPPKVEVGAKAPAFKVKDTSGKEID